MHKYRKYFETEIGGKKRPFKFSINATAMFCDMRGIEKHEFDELFSNENFLNDKIPLDVWRDLIYCMIKDGQAFKAYQIDPTYEGDEFEPVNVGHWVSDWTSKEMSDFSERFFTTLATSIIEKVEESEGVKKKLRGRTSLSKLLKRLVSPRTSFGN